MSWVSSVVVELPTSPENNDALTNDLKWAKVVHENAEESLGPENLTWTWIFHHYQHFLQLRSVALRELTEVEHNQIMLTAYHHHVRSQPHQVLFRWVEADIRKRCWIPWQEAQEDRWKEMQLAGARKSPGERAGDGSGHQPTQCFS